MCANFILLAHLVVYTSGVVITAIFMHVCMGNKGCNNYSKNMLTRALSRIHKAECIPRKPTSHGQQ